MIDSSVKFTEKLRHNLDRGRNPCYYMTKIIQVVKISGTICISGNAAGMRFFKGCWLVNTNHSFIPGG